jgi:hypothetical protein
MAWYGVETEDFGKPHTPITDAGLWAWAQVFEFLSGYAGFPCEITDSCDGKGLAYHRMCKEWNLSAHSCPGATMTDMVRVNQRAEIVKRAKLIRAGSSSTPPPPDVPLRHVTIRGDGSLRALATKSSLHAEDILWQTSAHQPAGYGSLQLRYFRAGNWDAVMPTGMILWLGKAGLQDAPPPATAQVSWMTKLLKRRYGK